MIQVSVKKLGEPSEQQLREFRQYLAAPETGDDGLLKALLRSAMADVQEWEDQSLLPETVVLISAGRRDPAAPIRLYRSVDKVESVKDENGEDIPYCRMGNLLTIQRPARGVEVVYTTTPVPCGVGDAMLVKAYRLAAARYDGEDSKTQNQIIMEG